MIIDIHTHCFPDALAKRAIPALAQAAGIPARGDGTQGGLRRAIAQAGVDRALILPIATKPHQVPKVNQAALALRGGGLCSLGSVHPAYAHWRYELDRLCDAGIRGIKLHPEYQQFFVDDPALYDLYAYAFERGLCILFHCGVDLAYQPPLRGSAERMARVVRDFPGGVVIAAHMGGYRHWDDVRRHLLGKRLFLDTSFSLGELGPERSREMIYAHGAYNILFGSDWPWANIADQRRALHAAGLKIEEEQAILGGNARRLLGLPITPAGGC